MSIHYLIDPFTPFGDIIDVSTSLIGQIDSTGATVILVPDGVAIHNSPANLADLLTEKYLGLLASYAGFTDIVADACMDQLTVNLTLSAKVQTGAGFVHHVVQPSGDLISIAVPLGSSPTQCVVVWEEFSFTDLDDKTGRMLRTFVEESVSICTCAVSFDGGATFNFAGNGQVLNIPVPDQGNSFVIALTNPSGSKVRIGSWALVY